MLRTPSNDYLPEEVWGRVMTTQTALTGMREMIDLRHYEVHIHGSRKGRFEDLRDAISSARIAKVDRPISRRRRCRVQRS